MDNENNAEEEVASDAVNPHYLDHVVQTAEQHGIEVTQDIMTSNGVKLLAKGARVDAGMRERLLQYKLLKPLEECLEVIGPVTELQLQQEAERLLDTVPLLRSFADGAPQRAPLGKLALSTEVLCLLTVYVEHRSDRLIHAVGVALVSKLLARRFLPGDVTMHRQLCCAGLLHDVGELYLAPQIWTPGQSLDLGGWRQVMTHPLIGERVLRAMPGGGPVVAEAVAQHHERQDGFGYPRGLREDRISLHGQILAAAECLIGVLESGSSLSAHLRVATKLNEGDFSAPLLAHLRKGLALIDPETELPRDDQLKALGEAARLMQQLRGRQDAMEALAEHPSEALRSLVGPVLKRLKRLQLAFSSAGLDAQAPDEFVALLGPQDQGMKAELEALAHEFRWRLREMERAVLMRLPTLSDAERQLLQQLLVDLHAPAASV